MQRACSGRCDEYVIEGIRTNIPFHKRVAQAPGFAAGQYDTRFVERILNPPVPAETPQQSATADTRRPVRGAARRNCGTRIRELLCGIRVGRGSLTAPGPSITLDGAPGPSTTRCDARRAIVSGGPRSPSERPGPMAVDKNKIIAKAPKLVAEGRLRQGHQGVPEDPGGGPEGRPHPPEDGRAAPEEGTTTAAAALLHQGRRDLRASGLLPQGGRALQADPEARPGRPPGERSSSRSSTSSSG